MNTRARNTITDITRTTSTSITGAGTARPTAAGTGTHHRHHSQRRNKSALAALLILCILLTSGPLSALAFSATEPAIGQSLTKQTGLNIRKSATTSSAVLAKLDPNAYIQVIGETGDFYKVVYTNTGATGYCHKDYIRIVSKDFSTVTTKSDDLNLRRSATTSSKILYALANKTTIPVLDVQENGWVKVVFGKTVGYVYGKYLTERDSSNEGTEGNGGGSAVDGSGSNEGLPAGEESYPNEATRLAMCELAKDYLGTLYEWGGDVVSNPYSYGFDCSHFTFEVMKAHGLMSSYRTAANQYSWCDKITRSELLPGDLVFYKSASTGKITHVTMYIGDGMVIGANGGTSSTNTPSRAESINAKVKIQSIDYSSRERLYGRAPGLN